MILVVCSFVVIKGVVSDSYDVIQRNFLTACTHLKRIRDVK